MISLVLNSTVLYLVSHHAMITQGFHDPDFLVESQLMVSSFLKWILMTCEKKNVVLLKVSSKMHTCVNVSKTQGTQIREIQNSGYFI